MKRRGTLLAVLLGCGAIAWLMRDPSENPPEAASAQAEAAPALAKPVAGPPTEIAAIPATRTLMPSAEAASALHDPAENVHEDLSTLDLLISDYRRCFAENPVGENEEITASLMGRNPKGLVFLPSERAQLDAAGRLLDRWGHPYVFHALAADRMEIISAGPDRVPHTDDDVTLER